jgi:hypothetical protein
MSRNLLVLAALAVLLPLAAVAHAQSGPYKVLQTVKVGGDGGMDYVTADSANRNLYVARSGAAGHIAVFNLDTFAQVGDIPGTSAHGAVVDDVTGHGFATSRAITMFDAKTFQIIKTIPVQGNPDGYFNDTVNHRFYDLSHSAPNITVIDDKDGSILTTIDIGGAPEQGQFDGKNRIYVDIEDKGAIAVIDANTMKKTGQYDLSSKSAAARASRSTRRTTSSSPPAATTMTWSSSPPPTARSSPTCPSASAATAPPSTPTPWRPSAPRATAHSPSSRKTRPPASSSSRPSRRPAAPRPSPSTPRPAICF